MDAKFFLIFINLYLTFATQKVPKPKFPVDQISNATPEKRRDIKRTLLSRKRKHLQLSSIGGRVEVMQEHHQSYKRQSTAEETEYLTVHNQKRASVSPPAANMLTMKWSTELTQVASAYAARCIWEHNSQRTAQQTTFSNVGENLYVTSAATASPTAAITSWDNEKNVYNFEQNTCSGVCDQYTQLVWHNSEYLGCASHKCATFEGLDDRFNGGTIVVCNYGPGGNINTATNRPYIPGPPGQSLSCSFEDVIECPYLQNSNEDHTDWIVREGQTPSRSTGPSRAYGGKKYIYFEATGLTRRSFAYLRTPYLPESEYCVNFAYNMYGSGMGGLYAYFKNDNIDYTLVWYDYGNQGSHWKTESVYIPSGPNTFFYFVAVRGRNFKSDIALDDVSFTPGACAVTLPTDFDADD